MVALGKPRVNYPVNNSIKVERRTFDGKPLFMQILTIEVELRLLLRLEKPSFPVTSPSFSSALE